VGRRRGGGRQGGGGKEGWGREKEEGRGWGREKEEGRGWGRESKEQGWGRRREEEEGKTFKRSSIASVAKSHRILVTNTMQVEADGAINVSHIHIKVVR
jgi:hypothetical protein